MIKKFKKTILKTGSCFLVSTVFVAGLLAQTPKLTLDFTKATTAVSPMLYGLMTEEINHSYDGGLYAELIRNRIFKDDDKDPAHWSAITSPGSEASIALD